jgi:hypothetical protein
MINANAPAVLSVAGVYDGEYFPEGEATKAGKQPYAIAMKERSFRPSRDMAELEEP